MKIFYIGSLSRGATSRQRAEALKRLGHEVIAKDPYVELGGTLKGFVGSRIHYRTGYRLVQSRAAAFIDRNRSDIASSDIVWIDGGELFGKSIVRDIARGPAKVVLFNADDPTGARDGRRFDSLVEALPEYDLCVTVRDETRDEFAALGATALKTWRGVDEIVHAPTEPGEVVPDIYKGGITFVGTWIRGENRDEILASLVKAGLPISIWGARWERSPYWPDLKASWKGGALHDREYAWALGSADGCLGFMSHANRDRHTHRSLEIPYCGSVLIAERTSDHLEMFTDGAEALLWSTAEECASQCDLILSNPGLREEISRAGRARILSLGVENQTVLNGILEAVR